MNNYKKGNKVTHSSVFDMIPEEYRFEGYQRWMDYARYDWLENPKCEEWDNLIEEEVNGWVPLTFMLCVSVAGMISGALKEESIKVHMQNDLQERTAGFFAVACGGKTKETEGQKGHTYMIQYTWAETETNEPVLKDCKTESSYRKLIVSDHTIELLRRQRTIYMRNRMKYGEDFCNSNRVICKENGEPYRPKSFTRKWAKTLKKYGLRHIKLHGTRHSAISLLLSEGVPIQIVQQRAGHQDPKITLAVYSHVSKDKESLVADTLGEILFVWHENLQADK